MTGDHAALIRRLRDRLGDRRVLTRLVERVARAGDASLYRLTPLAVVCPRNADDVGAIFDLCREHGQHLTFRAAGTSLSGQAVTDGVMVDVATHFKELRVLDEGRRVAVEPGVIAAEVNAHLLAHHAKIGPDPASINTCMIGGVAANNASGMCCGVEFNAYRTMASMKLVLADGLQLDTADPRADDHLRRQAPVIHAGLADIRDRIRGNAAMAERIRRKYAIKNTCGYAMNAFIDFERPIDILAHLMIGSEGTLGFIAEITFDTLPEKPLKATALVRFEDLHEAGNAIAPLAEAGAAVLEIMDRNALSAVADDLDDEVEPTDRCAALLVEFQESDAQVLETRLGRAAGILERFRLQAPARFTRDPFFRDRHWRVRKGLYPSIGASRAAGTAVIIEDICVPPPRLTECIGDLQDLFERHGYREAIIFGHARDGNLHFVIAGDFAMPGEVRRYAALMDELTALVTRTYDGSLKAEHGTGRNIAPFVEREWGPDVHRLMREVKTLLDPSGMLNPGVVLNDDPDAHLKHLKVMPAVSAVVDRCIECGFCEPRCPSRNLTSTPRQRIAIARETVRLETLGDPDSVAAARRLRRQFRHFGEDSCAADGACAMSCPVKIDTGHWIRTLRGRRRRSWSRSLARVLARRYDVTTATVRTALAALDYTGRPGRACARTLAGLARRLTGGRTPALPRRYRLPAAAQRLPEPAAPVGGRRVVYFPACLTRTLGPLEGEDAGVGLARAVTEVLEACGIAPIMPDGIERLCCGQPFFSKGYDDAGHIVAERTIDALWQASDGGRLPIVCDTSTCSQQLIQGGAGLSSHHRTLRQGLTFVDFPTFVAREILPGRDDWPRLRRHAVLHPVCGLVKLGGTDDLRRVAETFCESVTVPLRAECCGFAGDRGLLLPELTETATRPEANEVAVSVADAARAGLDTVAYATCRTCEIGMTAATGTAYRSIAHLCHDAIVGHSPIADRDTSR